MSRLGLTDEDNIQEVSRLMPQTETASQEMENRHKFYLNPAQKLIYNFGARETFIRGGRGLGKTTILSLKFLNCAQTIPRGTGIFIGSSVKQLYTKTTPNLIKSLEQLSGLREGIHFFRGQPPAKLHWPMPLAKPRVWENAIVFYTGFVHYLVSMEVTATANSMNLCSIMGDEARYLPWAKYKEEVLPALRGELNPGSPGWNPARNPHYLSQFFMSDAAVTIRQQQWEHEEDTQTISINDKITDMLADLELCPELAEMPEFVNKLNKLRCQSRIFFNFSSLENIEILGEDYIRKMSLQMPELLFRIQILGQRIGTSRDGYYSNFNPDVHTYLPDSNKQTERIYNKMQTRFRSNIDGIRIEWEAPDLQEIGLHADDCTLDMDVVPGLPLRIAFDYGANSNFVCTGQCIEGINGRREARVLHTHYVVNEQKLRALCRKWSRYFAPHQLTCKDVIFYTDSTARQGQAYALEGKESRYENVVKDELKRMGWHVIVIDMKRPMLHEVKFQWMNDVLSGQTNLDVRINSENNECLLAAIDATQVVMSAKGPRKDKSLEKLQSEQGKGGKRSERTDGTDAFDSIIIGMGKYRDNGMSISSAFGPSGVFFELPTIR